MTQSGNGNGHKPEVSKDDLITYEPAYVPGDEETPIGWVETEPQEEGKFVAELPPELTQPDDPESPPNPQPPTPS